MNRGGGRTPATSIFPLSLADEHFSLKRLKNLSRLKQLGAFTNYENVYYCPQTIGLTTHCFRSGSRLLRPGGLLSHGTHVHDIA